MEIIKEEIRDLRKLLLVLKDINIPPKMGEQLYNIVCLIDQHVNEVSVEYQYGARQDPVSDEDD